MREKGFIAVSIIAGVLALILTYLLTRNINEEEINRARLEMQQLRSSRDSIKVVISFKDSLQTLLQEEVNQLRSETDRLRLEVDRLEERRAEEQLTVRKIRKKEALQQRFMETFPEMARSDWGVTEVYNEESEISLEYLLIPLWFSETFIIDHQNSLSYRKQRDKLLAVDSLHQEIGMLKDSLFVLEREKAEAFETGYNQAFARYEDINDKYIQVLQNPPTIEWGFPQWGVVAAGVGAGVLIGTQVGN